MFYLIKINRIIFIYFSIETIDSNFYHNSTNIIYEYDCITMCGRFQCDNFHLGRHFLEVRRTLGVQRSNLRGAWHYLHKTAPTF